MADRKTQNRAWFEDAFQEQEESGESESAGSPGSAGDFARMLEGAGAGKKRYQPGDRVLQAEVLVAGREEIFVALGGAAEGIVPRRELMDAEENVSVKTGDRLDLFVTGVKKGGEIYLSPKPTAKNMADDIAEAYAQGATVEGRVSEVCKGGFRIAIKGKLAFCPISQIDSRRVEVPEDYIGKKLPFVVTQFSEGGRNIVVSHRKLLDEQKGVAEGSFLAEHKPGAIVPGIVKRLEKFGAFIEVAPGLEGLAHISELSWSRVAEPSEVVSPGQPVSVKILKIENVEGKVRIGLSIKQAGDQPWENLPVDVRAGNLVEGKVTRCADFGAFVELAPGIEGLVPMSEMSYTQRVMRSNELVSEGERITVMIKDVNPETKRISLSLKDAGSDPWALVAQKFPVGTILQGTVERREAYGLFVKLEDGITGLLPKSKALEQVDFPYDKIKLKDTVTVQVAEIRREERRISLQPPKDPGADDWKGFVAPASGTAAGFGGAFGDALKKAMEKKSPKG